MTEVRHPTQQELAQGWIVCSCGKFAHVFRAATLMRITKQHPNYHGERCSDCHLWMVAVNKLPKEPKQ